MKALLLPLLLIAAGLAGCSSDAPVREIEVHIGYNADGRTQYMDPAEIKVKTGEKIRLVITNDDKTGAYDSFHDVAIIWSDTSRLEHEVRAGATIKTCQIQQDPCPEGKDYFVAPAKGTYRVICEVREGQASSHENAGMKGVLIVE